MEFSLMVLCRRLRAVLAGLLVLSGLAPFASGQADANLKRLQAEARKQMEQNLNRTPLLKGTYKMADVCQVVFEKGQLEIKTTLAATRNGQARVEIEGLPGTTIVSCFGRSDQPARGWSFSLNNIRFDDPEAVQVDTNVSGAMGSFSMGRSCRLPNGYRNVSLSQSQSFVGPGQPPVPIVIFNASESTNNGKVPVNINAQASDFATLRRQRPKEIEQYLRPLLHDMQLDCLMAPDPLVAWQIFAGEWAPDEKVAAQVKALLPRLDDDSYKEREAALKELQDKGNDAVLVVYHMDRKPLSPQQKMLLDTFLAPVLTLPAAEAQKMRADRDFLLDCLYSDQPEVRAAALANLRKVVGRELKFDAGETFQQRVAAVEDLRATLAGRPTSGPATRGK